MNRLPTMIELGFQGFETTVGIWVKFCSELLANGSQAVADQAYS